jgi:hypothetical protein
MSSSLHPPRPATDDRPGTGLRSDPGPADTPRRARPMRLLATGLCGVIAGLYLLIYAGVLSVGEATGGELGILGFAAGVFAVLALLLWRVHARLLWAAVAVLQVLVIAAYVAISAEREPPFEVWGISIRVLQVALLATLVGLLVGSFRASGRKA